MYVSRVRDLLVFDELLRRRNFRWDEKIYNFVMNFKLNPGLGLGFGP